MATFSTDVGVEPAYIDFIDIGAGYGVLSVPVDGFFPGDVVQLAALSIAPFAGGPAVITGSVDMVQRTAGFLEYTSATSISAHFTLTAANIATIAAGAFQYSVTVSVLRNGVTETRQVQIGNIAARTSLTPPSPLIVADIIMSGGPVSGGIGTTAPLTAVAYDALGNVIPTAVITWSSSNPLVAQPDQSGLVSFLLPGSTTIIAASMGVQATTTATANDPAFVAPSNKQVAGWLTSDAAWLPHSLDASWIAPGTFAAGGGAPFIFPNPVQATSFAGDGSALTNLAAAAVAGVLPVAHGGTGVATVAAGDLLVGAGTGAMTALAPGAAAGFVRSDGATWTRAPIVTADVSDLTTAATGITKLGTVNTGTWQGGSIATTYTDAKIKTVTGTLNRLTVGGTSTDPTFDVSTSYAGQATITTLGTVATGTWQGSVIATAYTAAKVATVTGTLDRLTIGGTATDPTFDIAGTYVGQTSIVTLGTVTTGTWNASVISTGYTSAQLIDLTGTSSRIVIGGTSTHPTVDISGAYIGQGSITTLGTITSGVWNGTAIADAYLAALSVSKLTGTTLPASIVSSSLTTVGTIGTGTWQGSAIANAYLASGIDVAKLTTGTTLPSNVVTSSLTTVGVIGAGTWQGGVISSTYGGTGVNNAGATITIGGNVTVSGAHTLTLTISADTSVTLPTTGTLVNSAVTTLSSLVSIGTVTTGAWNATPIANAYIASGLDVTKLTAGATLPGNVTGSSLTSVGTIGTGVWQGSSIATTYTDAKVKTVTGTVNRLTIAGTATDPTFDIAAAYVGQASITTLGTITTGTWAGTTIGTPNGGTGLTGYTLGDIIYALNTNALAKLPGNTNVTQKFLSMTGDGVNAAAPSWQAISITTLPALTLTGTLTSTLGTVTASTPWLSSTASWNNGAVTFTHDLVNIFDTASSAASLLADWQVGGVSQWKVTKGGAVTQTGTLNGQTISSAANFTGSLGVTGTLTAHANIVLAADGAEVSTTTAGVTTTRLKTDGSGGLLSVDGNNSLRLRTNGVDRLSINGAGNVVFSGTITSGTWQGGVIADTYTQAKLITVPGAGRTVTSGTTYLANNSVFNVLDYGADASGGSDSTTAINAAVTAASAVTSTAANGARVYFPPGTYVISSQIVAGPYVTFSGSGSRSTCIKSSVADFAFKIGTTGGVLAYGNAISDLAIVMTNTAGGAVQLIGTCMALAANLYIEGVVSGGCTGVFIDGGNAANIFTKLDNVTVNHAKFGCHVGTSGSQVTTSIDSVGFRALCDLVGGGIGILVDNSSGQGSRFIGGNLESCETGISCTGVTTQFLAIRFEGNTTDVILNSGARGNTFIGCVNISTFTDNSAVTSNKRVANISSTYTNNPTDYLGLLTVDQLNVAAAGSAYFNPNGTTARSLLVDADNTYTGKLFIQAGRGSAGYGASLTLYGHTHATHPGDVVAGISSASGGKFRVNSQAQDGGTDWFTVSSTTVTAPNGLTITTGGATVSAGGITVTGNSTITGTLGGLTGLTVASGNILASSGNLTLTSGIVGIGGATNSSIALFIQNTGLVGANQYGIASEPTFSSAATTAGYGVQVFCGTAAAAFTMAAFYGLHVTNTSLGAGSAITNQYGVYIDAMTSGGTNYSIYTNGGTASFGDNVTIRANGLTVAAGGISITSGDMSVVAGNYYLQPSGTNNRYILINGSGTFAGAMVLQAGGGSSAFGASFQMYGHSHATHPGDAVACISSGSGGFFRVNSAALDSGTDWLKLNGTTMVLSGAITFSTAASKIIPGATSFSHRNNADSADNLLISDAGLVTVRAGLTLTAGALTFGAAASQIVPGATSFSHRNNANNADNLLITDAGAVTIRTSLTVTTGFGCNGTAAQTAVAGMAALAAYGAGANGFDTAGHAQEIHDKLNTILTALRANGIGTT